MTKFIFLLAVILWIFNLTVSRPNQNDEIDDIRRKYNESLCNISWENFKHHNRKSYGSFSEPTRRIQFQEQKKRVLEHNSLFKAGKSNFYTVLNKFTDLVMIFLFLFKLNSLTLKYILLN